METLDEAQESSGHQGTSVDEGEGDAALPPNHNEDKSFFIQSSQDFLTSPEVIYWRPPLHFNPRVYAASPPATHPTVTSTQTRVTAEATPHLDHPYLQLPVPPEPLLEPPITDILPPYKEIYRTRVPLFRYIAKPLRKEVNQVLQVLLDNVNQNPTSTVHHLLLNAFPKCVLQVPKRGGKMNFKDKQRFLKQNIKLWWEGAYDQLWDIAKTPALARSHQQSKKPNTPPHHPKIP
jgi:hypothetical protein